jgi:hypothetical protein
MPWQRISKPFEYTFVTISRIYVPIQGRGHMSWISLTVWRIQGVITHRKSNPINESELPRILHHPRAVGPHSILLLLINKSRRIIRPFTTTYSKRLWRHGWHNKVGNKEMRFRRYRVQEFMETIELVRRRRLDAVLIMREVYRRGVGILRRKEHMMACLSSERRDMWLIGVTWDA